MLLCNLDHKLKIVEKGIIKAIRRHGCNHHRKLVGIGCFRVQLTNIVKGKGTTPLMVPTLDDYPPQLELQDVKGNDVVWEACFIQKGP